MGVDNVRYVPVLNGSVLNCALRDDHFIGGKRVTFYTKDGMIKYPIFLINPFHHDKLYETIKKKGLIPDDSKVLADSVIRDETIVVKDNNGVINNFFIGDFVDKLLNTFKKTDDGHEYSTCNNYEVLTIDNNGDIVFKKIEKVIRHKVNKTIYRITTTSGMMIEVTGDHSLINLSKDGGFFSIKGSDLQVRKDNIIGLNEVKSDIFNNQFKEKFNLIELLDRRKIVVDKEGYIKYRNQHKTKFGEHKVHKDFLLDKLCLNFLGYWIGDGSFCKNDYNVGISTADSEPRTIFDNFCKRFFMRPVFNGKYDSRVYSKLMKDVMIKLDVNGYSHTKRVPNWIYSLSKEQIGWFLQGYFEADGSTKLRGESVGIMTVSKGLHKDLCLLLKILGISFNVRYVSAYKNFINGSARNCKASYILMIYGKSNLSLFKKYIGFISQRKSSILNSIINVVEKKKAKDYINNIPIELFDDDFLRKNGIFKSIQNKVSRRRLLKKCLDIKDKIYMKKDFGFYQIKSIDTYRINDYVYDLSVKDIERFLCSCVLVHNSGGLQATTLGQVKHSPEEVFKWQQANSNIGFSVDDLPFITPGDGTVKPGSMSGWEFDKANFTKHAEKSKENIEVTKKHRDKEKYPKFKFYGIIQGRNYREFLQWYEIIRDDVYLDGYCCKASDMNPMTIAETCIFVMQNINKPVHFLGIGNLSRSIVIYYASRYLNQFITFDSSSYDIGTQYRSYLLPFMMNRKLRFVSNHHLQEHSKEITGTQDIVHLQDATAICGCEACRMIGDDLGEMIETNNNKLGSLISIHNFIHNIRWVNYVKAIIDSKYKLEEFVRFNFENHLAEKILKAFEMIDLAAEKGYEFALHKFKDDIQKKQIIGKQKNIFNF